MKPNNVIYLKCTEDSFYRMWIEFLTPFHKLTAREKDVAARILMQYFRFKDNVQDPEVLKELMWSRKSRKDLMESLNMSQAHFQIMLSKLRASGVIINDDINPKYIPHKSSDGNPLFMLQIVYDWSTPSNPIHREQEPSGGE